MITVLDDENFVLRNCETIADLSVDDCFSMDMIRGVYKKEIEHTFRVTLIKELDEIDDSNFNDIVETLKYVLNQECILVEYIDSHSKLV